MIDITSGLWSQVQQLKKRLKKLDTGRANASEIKNVADALEALENRLAKEKERKAKRKEEADKAAASKPEAVTAEAAPEKTKEEIVHEKEKSLPGIIPMAPERKEEVVKQVEKRLPIIAVPEEPTKEAATTKYAVDSYVEPARGTPGSVGRVMRHDDGTDVVYVMWEKGPLKDKHGFGGYSTKDIKSRSDLAMPGPVGGIGKGDRVKLSTGIGGSVEDILERPSGLIYFTVKTDDGHMRNVEHKDLTKDASTACMACGSVLDKDAHCGTCGKHPEHEPIGKEGDNSGWSNRETFQQKVWIDNNPAVQKQIMDLAHSSQGEVDFFNKFRQWFDKNLKTPDVDTSMVNFMELAQAFYNKAQQVPPPEQRVNPEAPEAMDVVKNIPQLSNKQKIDQLLEQLHKETDPERKDQIRKQIERMKVAK